MELKKIAADLELAKQALESIRQSAPKPIEITCYDIASIDQIREYSTQLRNISSELRRISALTRVVGSQHLQRRPEMTNKTA